MTSPATTDSSGYRQAVGLGNTERNSRMSNDLDVFVKSILLYPVDRCRRSADGALASLPSPASRILDWNAFQDRMILIHATVEQHLLGLKEPVTAQADQAWGRCLSVLSRAFGQNGAKVAFELIRTSKAGGIGAVERTIAHHLADDMATTHIRMGAHSLWGSLSAQRKNAVVDEFLQKYGAYLPSELTEGGAWRIRADFPAILEHFADMLQRLSQIGGGR